MRLLMVKPEVQEVVEIQEAEWNSRLPIPCCRGPLGLCYSPQQLPGVNRSFLEGAIDNRHLARAWLRKSLGAISRAVAAKLGFGGA